jgi:hypothetical protein
MPNFAQFWDEQSEWSQRTFGTDHERGPVGPLKHLAKEVQEVLSDTSDRMEYADLQFLVFDAARRAGLTCQELLALCFEKLDINKKRQWQKPTSSDEAVEHVRT